MADRRGPHKEVAAYVMALIIAGPVGLVTWLWSGSLNSATTTFAVTFMLAALMFLAVNVASETARRRARSEDRLFAALDLIVRKLDELRFAVESTQTASERDDL
jgi:Flp pilus assembly protein TadB